MEDVQRVREAILKGGTVFTDTQTDFIRRHAAILGEDGEAAKGKIQKKAVGPGCLPADIVKMTEDYCKDLRNRVMLRELSDDLEKGREGERTAQLKAMEAEISKIKEAGRQGDIAGLLRGRKNLIAQRKEYLKGIEADEDHGVTSDATGKWKKVVADLTDGVLEELKGMDRDVGAKGEDTLGPLRRAMGGVANLIEAVNLAKDSPEEGGLRDLGRKLGVAKKELMALGRDLMTSQGPALAAEAHDLAGEAEDAIRSRQKVIRSALRGLDVASDISEAGSLDLLPHPQRPVMAALTVRAAPLQAGPTERPPHGAGGRSAGQ